MSGGESWLERLELSDGGWPGNPERANRWLLFFLDEFGQLGGNAQKRREEPAYSWDIPYMKKKKIPSQPAGRSLFLPPRLGSY